MIKTVIHIINLEQALNHELVFKKVHRVIKFNQYAWLNNIYWYEHRSRNKSKRDFEKDFFRLMNIAVFGKTMENVRKHSDMKFATTDRRRKYLVTEST